MPRLASPLVAPVALGAIFLVAASPAVARAALGEAATSSSADLRSLAAVRRGTTALQRYAVHHLDTAAGAVREYAGPDGVVFAVTWEGRAPPDLDVLLGAYAGEVRAAFAARVREPGRRRSALATDRVVLETWGHMRALRGRAYLPAAVPEGVSLDDIR